LVRRLLPHHLAHGLDLLPLLGVHLLHGHGSDPRQIATRGEERGVCGKRTVKEKVRWRKGTAEEEQVMA
jgi:hypothetical protein